LDRLVFRGDDVDGLLRPDRGWKERRRQGMMGSDVRSRGAQRGNRAREEQLL
jgi:hypothetical protein